jgi:protoporphyrinogen oxidase
MSSCYDVIIVGAGIAGLRVGLHIVNNYPTIKCCIIEKYNYNGGRIVTYHKQIPNVGEIQWEIGAGRISRSHQKVLQLMKSYGLTYLPLSPEMGWIAANEIKENHFSELTAIYLDPLKHLPQSVLQTHTLRDILFKIVGKQIAEQFMIKFPYHAELYTLRADIALESFDTEMKSNEGFGVCKEGLSEMIQQMVEEFTGKGGIILQQMEAKRIESDKNHETLLYCVEQCGKNKMKRTLFSKACILALHSEAVKQIQGISHLPILRHLSMRPLVRIYAVFPVHQKKSWFSDLSKLATPAPIRYIIPIHPSRGIIMISYTDGADAEYWIKQQQEKVQSQVMKEIRSLFPDREIPDPIFFKVHIWNDGCTYWLPGEYNVEEESYKSLHPLPERNPTLFMCGESFAVKQCWMESALHQADQLIHHPKFKAMIKAFK